MGIDRNERGAGGGSRGAGGGRTGPGWFHGTGIGLDMIELLNAFKKLEWVTKAKIGRKIVRKAATPIKAAAKQLVPVDTGKLKRSIKIYTSVKRWGIASRVESREPYAHLVELGTDPHFQKRKLKSDKRKRRVLHPGAKPKPFLRPAFDANEAQSTEIARQELLKEILKATKKG